MKYDEPTNIREYLRSESVVFRKTSDEFGGLSNMAPNFPLEVGGTLVRTSEALYQACRFPHMPDVQQIILSETSPMTAKAKAKPFRLQSRADWDDVRVVVMRWCLRVKLAENWESFGGLLLATGERPIVEDSERDAFWGAAHVGGGKLRGTNALGRLLMELRKRLRDNPDSLRSVPPLGLTQFLLLGEPIGEIAPRSSSAEWQFSSIAQSRRAYLISRGQ